MISIIHPDNIRSRRVVRKNGLWFERDTVFCGHPVQIFAADLQRKTWWGFPAGSPAAR